MKLRKMNVEPAWGASGVQGFFEADKYWYHKPFSLLGLWFLFTTFVSKTSTLNARAGNMPLDEKDGITPKEWIPKCIVVKWWKRAVLNAVSLSGPGIDALLRRRLWQKRKKDFFISLMSVAETPQQQREEIRMIVRKIIAHIKTFGARVGIQLNVSCPNANLVYKSLVFEAKALLDVIHEEDPEGLLTVVIKLGPTTKAHEVVQISRHPRCDGFCLGNTASYGDLLNDIDWVALFGSADPKESPLIKRGFKQPGGYSGKELLKIYSRLIKHSRMLGMKKHINACGGILGPVSAWKALRAGADSISIGSAAMLAPWGVMPAIIMSHVVAWCRENFRDLKKIPSAFPFKFHTEYTHE